MGTGQTTEMHLQTWHKRTISVAPPSIAEECLQNTAGSPGAQEAYPGQTKFASLTKHSATPPHENAVLQGGGSPAAGEPRGRASLPGGFQPGQPQRSPAAMRPALGHLLRASRGWSVSTPTSRGFPQKRSGVARERERGKRGPRSRPGSARPALPSLRGPRRTHGHQTARGAHLQG